MASQRITPIAVAVVLTVAAGLSITEERMRSHAAATLDRPSLAPAVLHPASEAAARNSAVLQRNDKPAVTKASTTSATPSPSVGSRALVGD